MRKNVFIITMLVLANIFYSTIINASSAATETVNEQPNTLVSDICTHVSADQATGFTSEFYPMLLNSVKAIFVTVELEKNRNLDEKVLFQKNDVANLTECVLRKHTNIPIYSSEEQSTNNTRDSVHILVNLRLKTMDVANLDPFVIITVRFERNKPSVFSNKRMRYCADTFLLPNSLYAQQHALTKAMQYCLRPY